MHSDLDSVLYTEEAIAEKVSALGHLITADYSEPVLRGERLVLVCLLRGASIFAADLARRIELPLEMDFMCISSYGNSTKSSGTVRIQKDLGTDIEGAHVLIAEDVIDSGLTLSYLRKNLLSRNPASVEVVSLLKKATQGQADVPCKYVGFECGNEFVVGYGLDYAQRYRNLPYIGILKPEVYGA